MLIIGGCGLGKTNALLSLIKEQDIDSLIDKIYLYAEEWSEPKCQFLIKEYEDVKIKHLDDPKVFVECMDNVYNNIDDYNPTTTKKFLIVFDDMILDIMANRKFQVIFKEVFIRCTKLNTFLVFITQSHFLFQKKPDQILLIT